MHYFIIFLFAFLLLPACSPDREPVNYLKLRDNCHSTVNASEIFNLETVSLLRPPDSVTIGKIDQLVLTRNHYILLDREQSRSVVGFDTNGNFSFRIGSSGKGPREITQPEFMQIHPNADTLYIYDRHLHKIIVFALRQKQVIREIIHLPLMMYFNFLDDQVIYSTDDYESLTGSFPFIRFSRKLDKLKNPGYQLTTPYEIVVEAAEKHAFFTAENNLYYLQAFTNRLFRLTPGGAHMVLEFEFAAQPEPAQYQGSYTDVMQHLFNTGFSIIPHMGNLNNNLFSFFYLHQAQDIYLATIHLDTRQQTCFKTVNNDYYGAPLKVPVHSENGKYFIIEPLSELPEAPVRGFLAKNHLPYQTSGYLLFVFSLKPTVFDAKN